MLRKKMFFGLMIVIGLGLIGLALLALQARQQPRLRIMEPTFDMGVVPLGQVGHYQVRLSNEGSAPLQIRQIKPG